MDLRSRSNCEERPRAHDILNHMVPWELLDTAPVHNNGELRLYKRGDEYSIRIDGQELMGSRMHGSEEKLAVLACERIQGRKKPCILIGGLGMGYTLAAALDGLPRNGRVVVAELVPQVVAWNRGPLQHLAGSPLDDSRARVRTDDVAALIRAGAGSYDAILLDVDNGPYGLTQGVNDWLYSHAGLQAARAALRPSGVLAVWSAGPDRNYCRRLAREQFKVEQISAAVRKEGRGGRDMITLGTRGK